MCYAGIVILSIVLDFEPEDQSFSFNTDTSLASDTYVYGLVYSILLFCLFIVVLFTDINPLESKEVGNKVFCTTFRSINKNLVKGSSIVLLIII